MIFSERESHKLDGVHLYRSNKSHLLFSQAHLLKIFDIWYFHSILIFSLNLSTESENFLSRNWMKTSTGKTDFIQRGWQNMNIFKLKKHSPEQSCVLASSCFNKIIVKTTSTKQRLCVLDLETGENIYQVSQARGQSPSPSSWILWTFTEWFPGIWDFLIVLELSSNDFWEFLWSLSFIPK